MLKENKITHLWLTSALFDLHVDFDHEMFAFLTYLIVGGDIVQPVSIAKLDASKVGRPKHVLNGYGPTENTTFTTTYEIEPDRNYQHVPIGKPINNTAVFVLNKQKKPVPVGVPGKLYVAGSGVALGYLNLDRETKAFFSSARHFPWLAGKLDPEILIYDTGDMVVWQNDGNLEYLGRLDSQIKINGFRIELGEIEVVAKELIDIKAACALPYGDTKSKSLALFLVQAADCSVEEEAVLAYLQSRLPSYSIPQRMEFIEKLPLSPHGKIDKNVLRQQLNDHRKFDLENKVDDDLVRKVIKVWESVFERSVIATDDFFRLGGHSLLAVQLINTLNKEMNIFLPISKLYEKPTPIELADLLSHTEFQSSDSVHDETNVIEVF